LSGINFEFYSVGSLLLKLTTDVSFLYSHLNLANHVIYGVDEIRVASSSHSDPKYCFDGSNNNTGMYCDSSGRVGLCAGGARRIICDTADNIYFLNGSGIGITRLQIAGNAIVCHTRILPTDPDLHDLGSSAQAFRTIYVKNAIQFTSDCRAKRDIKPLTLSLDFINKLSPKTYIWNNTVAEDKITVVVHDRVKIGLLAQDVADVIYSEGLTLNDTDLVGNPYEERMRSEITANRGEKRDDDDQYTISYSSFVPILINAVKELSKKNEDLEIRIKKIEDYIASL
jgi:hypothetical protein